MILILSSVQLSVVVIIKISPYLVSAGNMMNLTPMYVVFSSVKPGIGAISSRSLVVWVDVTPWAGFFVQR